MNASLVQEFNHPPGVSYCPECYIVREYTSIDPSRCARFGTWASHCYSMLRHGPNNFQDYCCQCLTRYDCKLKFGSVATFSSFPFEKESCSQCKLRNEAWIWIGYSTRENTKWRKINPVSANFYVEGSGDAESLLNIPEICGLEFPTHISNLPEWIFNFSDLEFLNLKCCVHLQQLPLEDLINRLSLKNLNCAGCSQLWSPPQEVCNQGGEITIRFLQEVKARGEFSSEMTLFLLGDGEVGKTSIVLALKSDDHKAPYIRNDYRTVGIDVTFWKPPQQKMEYVIYDLAGQAVYAKTHQLFMLRRAVYLLVWRAGTWSDETLRTTIKFWLDSLQNRMPGSFIIPVVTHIDQVEKNLLDIQCENVSRTINDWTTAMKSNLLEGIPILRCWDKGNSMRVNCLSGDGVLDLRTAIIRFSSSMPWYKECLPPSWIRLHKELAKYRKSQHSITVPHITWEEYLVLTKSCDISKELLFAATKFLHDTGVIRYFGDLVDSIKKKSDPHERTVYISTSWMMNVIKGLIRHDRQALLDYFWEEADKVMLRQTNRFSVCGMLHRDLVPFLWPSQQRSEKFWNFVRSKGAKESELWTDNIVSSTEEGERAIELLKGLDLLAEAENEFFVPSALPPSKLPCTPKIDIPLFPYNICFTYNALPPGAFDTVVVRLLKHTTKLMSFSSALATICNEKGHKAQLISLRSECGKGENLVLRSSASSLLHLIENEIVRMEGFYAGLLRLDRTKRLISACERIKAIFSSPLSRVDHIRNRTQVSPTSAIVSNVCSANPMVAACIFNREETLSLWKKQVAANKGYINNAEQLSLLCTNCGRTHLLIEILTNFRVPENRPCPNAINHGFRRNKKGCVLSRIVCQCFQRQHVQDQDETQIGYTQTFNAGECRLHLMDNQKESSVVCYSCLSAGLLGLVSVSDIIPAEVFVSGFMSLEGRTQSIFTNVIKTIQVEADVLCKIVTKDDMLEIQEAMFFVALLSDAYFVSNENRKQFGLALSLCKHIIPILLPASEQITENGVSFGWTGARDEDYWKHAVQFSQGTTGKESFTDFSFLKHFEALEMQIAGSFDCHDMHLGMTVAKKIKLHLQRPGKIDLYSDFSILGIRLSYLDSFISRFGGRDEFLGLTTTAVMESFIKPATAESKLSFCELMVAEDLGDHVGVSQWFLSHAWNYIFLDVVDATKEFFSKQKLGNDPYIWFDIFSVSQHKAASRPFEWWNSAFLNAVGSIGRVLMVMQPFEDTESGTCAWITLTRVWCVFEIYACESTLSQFHVTMTREMASKFLESVKNCDMDMFLSLISIDCEQSTAFKKEDKEQVFEVIRKSVGFPLLNSIVLRVIERWLYYELFIQIMESGCKEKSISYLQSIRALSENVVTARIRSLGDKHPDTIQAETILSHVLKAQENEGYLSSLMSHGGKEFKRVFGLEKNEIQDNSVQSEYCEITDQKVYF